MPDVSWNCCCSVSSNFDYLTFGRILLKLHNSGSNLVACGFLSIQFVNPKHSNRLCWFILLQMKVCEKLKLLFNWSSTVVDRFSKNFIHLKTNKRRRFPSSQMHNFRPYEIIQIPRTIARERRSMNTTRFFCVSIPRSNKMIATWENCWLNHEDWVITMMSSRELPRRSNEISLKVINQWINHSFPFASAGQWQISRELCKKETAGRAVIIYLFRDVAASSSSFPAGDIRWYFLLARASHVRLKRVRSQDEKLFRLKVWSITGIVYEIRFEGIFYKFVALWEYF